jgi:predicted ATPase/DNA-binding SARP family transcriptional activator
VQSGAPRAEFRLLGSFEALVSGEPVRLGGPKQRALLAILLLSPGEVVSVDRLIQELWGDSPPKEAAHTIQVFVSRLRQALGKDVLETKAPGYRVRATGDEVDVGRFERLSAAGRAALEQERFALAERTLAEALALFRGPPLADFEYEAWALGEASRLEEARLSCLEQWVEASLALGRHAELVGALERLVAEHRTRERFRAQLMLALYRDGRQAEALESFRQARSLLDEELGVEPSPELKDLHRRILNQDETLALEALAAPEVKLPRPATPFLGRRRELAEVEALLGRDDVSLLTLTGPGGSGKTRLALQAAAVAADRYRDGTYWVPLAGVGEPHLVLPAIADALDVDGSLGDYLGNRELLLVLDNFEQVLEAAAELSGLLAGAARVAALVTSREPLRVYGEHEYRVPGLAAEDAVELFRARTSAVQGSADSNGTVRAICERLDHLPLAIELAAARTRDFSPELIHARLEQRLPLLVDGPRDVPERHRTLRAAIDWSHELLTEQERIAFRRLAVFAGGCPVQAAETVCEAPLEVLSALAAKSLVRSGTDRVWMLETIREYAAERLADTPDFERAHRSHARWCLDAVPAAAGTTEESLERAWLEQHNLRAAVAWARSAGEPVLALELTLKLADLLSVRASLVEARALLEAALDEAADAPEALRAATLHAAAGIALKQGDTDAIRSLSETALRLADEMNDTEGAVRALAKLAVAALEERELEAALRFSTEATRLALESGDDRARVNALNAVGTVELARENYADARAAFEAALDLASGHLHATRPDTVATLHYNIAVAAFLAGDEGTAEQTLEATLELYRALAHVEGVAYCFVVQAARRASRGELSEAAELLAAAERLLASVGAALEPVERSLADETRAAVEAALDEQALAAAHDAGVTRADAELSASSTIETDP